MKSLVFLCFCFLIFKCSSVSAAQRNARSSDADPIVESWWLSDNEIVYRREKRASIYNTLTGELSEVSNRTSNSSSDATVSYSRDLSYTAEMNEIPRSHRNPDRKTYTVSIRDNINGYMYFLADGAEILAFNEGHGKGVYSFVKDDDVYYISSPEKPATRVTNGGASGMIHGRFDWVYGEEIFGRDQIKKGAMWFSPSDKYLAYASRHVNSSNEHLMTTYEQGNVYDYNYNMEYPKTGEKRLAVMSVSIWSAERNESITLDVNLRNNGSFHYLYGVSWVVLHGKELLLTTWANRWQNETQLSLCDFESATCSLIYEHKYDHGQWASHEDYESIVYSIDSIFVILPEAMGDNAWQHIAKLEITSDYKFKSLSFIPSGAYDIRKVVGYRSEEDLVIYEAQAPLPWQRHVYAAPTVIRSALKEDRCLACEQSNCTYQKKTAISSSENLTIRVECNGQSSVHNAIFTFNSTLHLSETKMFPGYSETRRTWKTETYRLTNGYEAIVRIYEGNTTLDSVTVTLIVYGGPDFNKVTDEFTGDPDPSVISNNFEHAVVYIDVRGSGGRGWKYRSAIYGRLATVEVEDTVEAMQMILEKYPRFDRNRVGVIGWSYGGTMSTALVESAPEGFFKCAFVGAPVTNFIYYDATYTERYMGDAPRSSYVDLTVNVTKFQHTKLMLAHGMRDDNVHFQNSALLIEALQNADIQFELMVYPNQPHSIHFDHLRQLKETFFSTCYA